MNDTREGGHMVWGHKGVAPKATASGDIQSGHMAHSRNPQQHPLSRIVALTPHRYRCRCGAEFEVEWSLDSFGCPFVQEATLLDGSALDEWTCGTCGVTVTQNEIVAALEVYRQDDSTGMEA